MNTPEKRAQLVESAEGMICGLASRFCKLTIGMGYWPDACQEGRIGAWRSSGTFDPDRGLKFTTYAHMSIVADIRNFIRKTLHHTAGGWAHLSTLEDAEDSLELFDNRYPDPVEAAERAEVAGIVRGALAGFGTTQKAGRRRAVLELRYGLGDGYEYSSNQTARIIGISRQTVDRMSRQAERQLSERIPEGLTA